MVEFDGINREAYDANMKDNQGTIVAAISPYSVDMTRTGSLLLLIACILAGLVGLW